MDDKDDPIGEPEEHTYCFFPKQMWPNDYLLHLLAEGEVHVNNGWWFENEGVSWPKDAISVHLNCNDTFAFSCADSEDIRFSDLKPLFELYRAHPVFGTTAWAIAKRGQFPIHPLRVKMEEAGWDVEGLVAGKPVLGCFTPGA